MRMRIRKAGAIMSATCCNSGRATLARRCVDVAGYVVPASILALLPKCPVCVAAYVALASGLGISVTAASYLRTGVIIACVATLLFVVVRTVGNCTRRRMTDVHA
jgi:hypothetical protein